MHNIPRHSLLKCLALLFLCSLQQAAFSQPSIVLNTAFGTPMSTPQQTGFVDQIVTEAFKRIGYQLEIIRTPPERALINANLGIDDGDVARVPGLQKIYPNLIQVPEYVVVNDMVLFSKNKPSFVVDSWQSMKSHSLAIISGWKIMEKNFSVFSDQIKIIKTDNAEQSFTLLLKDRVDFIAYSKWSGLGYLKSHGIKNITLLNPPLASLKFYVYLHKKHKEIVPQLANAIKQMRADGTIKKLFDEILTPLM